MIPARILCDDAFKDACILNLSSRGLLLQTSQPPRRGAYLDVRRGRHVIVGKVAWSKHHRCGVRTQDPLPIDELLNDREPTGSPRLANDRRSVQRAPSDNELARRAERNRWRSRAFEFARLAMFGAALATTAFGLVRQTLARPLMQLTAQLNAS